MNIKTICFAITCSSLVACGGGGSNDTASLSSTVTAQGAGPVESVGVFLDSPVRGLRYETPTRSGLTNIQGEFRYLEGESVTFLIGNTVLGSAQGSVTITPFSLFDATPLTKESEIISSLKNNTVNDYDRAINVATFLQTLDRDADPDNGIDLGLAHTELSDITVNLSVKAHEFIRESSLGVAKNMLALSKQPKLSQVTTHLYHSLGLGMTSDLVNQFTASRNARESITTRMEYDDSGNITSQGSDTDNDGVVDSSITYIYDDVGNLTSTLNTATDVSETLAYDENNNLISHFTDKFRQADIQQTFSFNENNTLSRLELDHGADGNVESTITYAYDADGQLVSYEIDQGSDGSDNASASYSYGDNGVSAYDEDSDNNGDSDLSITYQYDDEGKRISQRVNTSTAGLPSNAGTFEYDNNGNITRYEQDNNLDGRADYIESSSYDSNNKRTSYRRDIDANGTWDSVTQYTYDAVGNRTSMNEDSDGDGTIDKQWSSNYETTHHESGWDLILGKLDSET